MGQPDPRAAVRVAAFDRSLAAFNDEIGWKTGQSIAASLQMYHNEKVEPLQQQMGGLLSIALPPRGPVTKRAERVLCWLGFHASPRLLDGGRVPQQNAPYAVVSCRSCRKTWVAIGEPYGQSEYVRRAP
jgi:hypothetical protein